MMQNQSCGQFQRGNQFQQGRPCAAASPSMTGEQRMQRQAMEQRQMQERQMREHQMKEHQRMERRMREQRMQAEVKQQDDCGCRPERLSREQLLKRITLHGFAMVDLNLYLDTHPQDREALCSFRENSRIYREALEEYSKNYGPLTIAHAHHCDEYWNWVNQPWPWQ